MMLGFLKIEVDEVFTGTDWSLRAEMERNTAVGPCWLQLSTLEGNLLPLVHMLFILLIKNRFIWAFVVASMSTATQGGRFISLYRSYLSIRQLAWSGVSGLPLQSVEKDELFWEWFNPFYDRYRRQEGWIALQTDFALSAENIGTLGD